MKKICLITGVAMLAAVASAWVVPGTGKVADVDNLAGQTADAVEAGGKVLVTYFTWPEPDGVDASSGASRVVADGKLYGNTEYVARMIAEATDGDLFAIETEKKYPSPHKALIDEAKREAEAGECPRMTTHIPNLGDYDVIPFVTHGGSRFSQSVETIGKLEPEVRVVRGPSVSGREVPNARQSEQSCLEKQGLLKK